MEESELSGTELLRRLRADDWNQALRMLASTAPEHQPSIVVLDEVPWLVEHDRELEGALQTRLGPPPVHQAGAADPGRQ